MTTSISTDVLAIVAICFTIFFAKRNIVINNFKNKIYITASVATIILLLTEIATILMELSSNTNLVIFHRIANIIGFSLCPVVPYMLLIFNVNVKERTFFYRILYFPIFFNTVLCIISYKTGWIFFVDYHNQYTRGILFLLPTIISMIYFVLMIIAVIRNRAEYEIDDKMILLPIMFIPLVGTVLQILFKDLLLIWGSTSMSLLIYYIFLRELQFKYDVQTGIKNRVAFEKEMTHYLKDGNNATIVVLDINNFKNINDIYGHKIGDEVIFNAANIIKQSFMGIGKTFRIGGDEFCVICKEVSNELVDSALSNLDNSLVAINENRKIKIKIAYGYAIYTKNKSENIYSVFSKADKAMYLHKAKLKK